MRIIGGSLKGRKIHLPRQLKARPTTDFAREGLFNWLQHHFPLADTVCADFFCGSGLMGLEMVSRGASQVYSLDVDAAAIRHLKSVCAEWGVNQIKPIRGAFHQVIKVFKEPVDLIFADPPYTYSRYPEIPEAIRKANILKPAGYLIIEHGSRHNFSEQLGFVEQKKYGNVHFSFFTFDDSTA